MNKLLDIALEMPAESGKLKALCIQKQHIKKFLTNLPFAHENRLNLGQVGRVGEVVDGMAHHLAQSLNLRARHL